MTNKQVLEKFRSLDLVLISSDILIRCHSLTTSTKKGGGQSTRGHVKKVR